MDVLLGIVLIVVAVIAFAVWLFASILGFFARAVFGPSKPAQASNAPPAGAVPCQSTRCRAANPAFARYCRRCGRAVAAGVAGREARMKYVA